MTNSRRHDIRLMLYTLKRKWGVRAAFHKVTVGSPNLDTGDKGVTYQRIKISRLITSVIKTIRKFEYDIGYLAANKNFTYGGFYEAGDRLVLIGNELGQLKIEMADYFVINHQRYDISRSEELDEGVGFLVHLKRTKNNPACTHCRIVNSDLALTQTVEAEL